MYSSLSVNAGFVLSMTSQSQQSNISSVRRVSLGIHLHLRLHSCLRLRGPSPSCHHLHHHHHVIIPCAMMSWVVASLFPRKIRWFLDNKNSGIQIHGVSLLHHCTIHCSMGLSLHHRSSPMSRDHPCTIKSFEMISFFARKIKRSLDNANPGVQIQGVSTMCASTVLCD